jgi:hypothetical protein
MSHLASSPLAQVLHCIFCGNTQQLGATASSEISVINYGDIGTFRDLWLNGLLSETPAINGIQFNWKDHNRQMLIVGNSPPDSLEASNISSHITAVSWLAAWKVKFPNATTQIAVVDPSKADLLGGASAALQTIFTARDSTSRPLVTNATVLSAPSLDTVCKWLTNSKNVRHDTPSHICDLIKSTIWNELTSSREHNHALSNAMGAILLQAEVPAENEAALCNAPAEFLLQLVNACGIALDSQQSLKPQVWLEAGLRREIPSAVLLDDMADLWAGFLKGALGIPNVHFLEGKTFKEEILNVPSRLINLVDEGTRRLSTLDLVPSVSRTEDFVLFLDLRLFAEGEREISNRFSEEFAKFGRRLLAARDSGRHLPWVDDAKGFSELESELDGELAHPRETLLPRFLSLLDPTLPIIIFSSTHRTELIDPFRDYGNIITAFRKPILTGLTADWASTLKELKADFISALDRAASILAVRKLLRQLEPIAS